MTAWTRLLRTVRLPSVRGGRVQSPTQLRGADRRCGLLPNYFAHLLLYCDNRAYGRRTCARFMQPLGARPVAADRRN